MFRNSISKFKISAITIEEVKQFKYHADRFYRVLSVRKSVKNTKIARFMAVCIVFDIKHIEISRSHSRQNINIS